MRNQFFGEILQGLFLFGGSLSTDQAPVLLNTSGVISVVQHGFPSAPHLTNTNGTITAEAA